MLTFLVSDAGTRPRVTGVIFKDEKGNQHQALLSNRKGSEVILSSGAIGSPQMLILSGIGPKRELKRLKIPLVLANEHVGKGMADNPMNTILVPSKQPIEQSLIQTVGITKMGVYVEASTGFGQSPESIHTHYGVMSDKVTLNYITSSQSLASQVKHLPRSLNFFELIYIDYKIFLKITNS